MKLNMFLKFHKNFSRKLLKMKIVVKEILVSKLQTLLKDIFLISSNAFNRSKGQFLFFLKYLVFLSKLKLSYLLAEDQS